MKITKEIKQKIAFNYTLKKSNKLIKSLESLNNEKFNKIRTRIFEIEKIKETDLVLFCNNIEKINSKFSKLLQHGQVNSEVNKDSIVNVNIFNNSVSINYIFNNVYLRENDFNYKPDSIVNSDFKCSRNGILEKDNKYISIIDFFHEKEQSLINDIQTHYDNIYELIKNIRTLDRLKKAYPDVILYLPENINELLKNEKEESLSSRLEKL